MHDTDTENIEWMARVLAGMLDSTDIMTLDASAVDALGRLFEEVTYDRREQVTERKGQLWRASAIVNPDQAGLERTELVNPYVHPDWISDVALVRRTDTGQHYVVSTNDEETLTWRCDEHGTRYTVTWPNSSLRQTTEDTIYVASGRGMTRAQAIHAIDTADAERLRPGTAWMWDDEWDDPFADVPDDTDDNDQEN